MGASLKLRTNLTTFGFTLPLEIPVKKDFVHFRYARVKSSQKKQQIFLLYEEMLYALEIVGYK